MDSVERSYDYTVSRYANDARKATESIRKTNNAVKRHMIDTSMNQSHSISRVLDLCGGRGGDMGKILSYPGVRDYCIMDISSKSIEEAKRRSLTHNKHGANLTFHATDVSQGFHANGQYDLINQQFSLHYMWSSPKNIDLFITSLSNHLADGGFWIGTVPNRHMVHAAIKGTVELPAFCHLHYIDDHSYTFYLEGCVENVKEYLVNFHDVDMSKYNLYPVVKQNLLDYCMQNGIRMPNAKNRMVNWLYDVFVFKKYNNTRTC